MPKTYDSFLVALSVLIAVWASYDALLLAGRVKVAGATAVLRLPVAVSYDATLVALVGA
jgi:NO-binding membrane sensor protein with MHYT domain